MIDGPYYDITCDDCGTKIRVQAVKECVQKGWEIARNNRKQALYVRCPKCKAKHGSWRGAE